jgi:hypothetical protein
MNGLQSLNAWKNYFNTPTGSKLGLLNAIQVRNFLSSFPSSVDHFFPSSEHRRSRSIPIRALPLRWHWTTSNRLPWCRYYVYRYSYSDRFPVRGDVHRCSVRALNGLSPLMIILTCLLSFLIGFGLTFAGNRQQLLRAN